MSKLSTAPLWGPSSYCAAALLPFLAALGRVASNIQCHCHRARNVLRVEVARILSIQLQGVRIRIEQSVDRHSLAEKTLLGVLLRWLITYGPFEIGMRLTKLRVRKFRNGSWERCGLGRIGVGLERALRGNAVGRHHGFFTAVAARPNAVVSQDGSVASRQTLHADPLLH